MGQFSDAAHVEFYLNETSSIDGVIDRLDGTNYTEGNTQTGAALNVLREDVFTTAHGDRPGAPNLAVVITDGASSDHQTLMNESSLMKEAGVDLVAVSVGFVTHPDELHAMAGQEILRVTSYAELVGLADDVLRLICDMTLLANQTRSTTTGTTTSTNKPTATTALTPRGVSASTVDVKSANTEGPTTSTIPGTPASDSQGNSMTTDATTIYTTSQPQTQLSTVGLSVCQDRAVDIVFVVDSSNSVGLDNFRKMKTFLISLVESLDIGPSSSRVGIIVFSDDATMVIRLEDTTNEAVLKSDILNIQYTGGGTNTAAALKLLSSTAFSHSPRHGNIPQVAVVLTDGLSRNTMLTKIQAEQLHAMGVKLFAIGIERKASTEELEIIGSKPSDQYVIAMSTFNDLSSHGVNFVASACKISDEICENTITNCKDYGTYICENPFYLKWVWEHCAAHTPETPS
ncbi:hypothetical protein EGW08_022000 [Elysia chlorotica]|uniref:VWFA domain-containing protein n=1 Tax=Elysia chlorotica TaxID=188477 RepID=A0A433SM38_ELYCH|nr:hypothetical protein EGW08_022000 [Elysia chlorotica]